MNSKKSKCKKCGIIYEGSANYCPKCNDALNKVTSKNSPSSISKKDEPAKIPVKPLESNYVTQIVSIGIRPDNIYEAKILLAPEVDLSSIKITVKGNNLRATVQKPLNDELANQLPGIVEESPLGDLVKKTVKHRENFLIPDAIDGDKVRAVVDNKHRMLILTAPAMKPSKMKKKSEVS